MSEASTSRTDAIAVFCETAQDMNISNSRFAVLEEASTAFAKCADLLQISGYIGRNPKELAAALLIRLGGELSGGILILAKQSLAYPAAALLRQLVEVEYLAFIGYADPVNLQNWYEATDEERRKLFTPQKMRKLSDGLFRDSEYWLHCEVGGHPHPKSKILLPAYGPKVPPVAALLPDAVHHIRRLWTSVSLLLPQLDAGDRVLEELGTSLPVAIANWESNEHPMILAFDGIGT